mmetsp:Transcript_112328/g.318207  ORF Transcript_112328/g.318207 Transcript_112328/m.318207 type:complete len:222 (-) Transcript_112328:571-1236(-)|eukprot:CAMPEP_0179373886 /NCGR_PEP_ID=MMETSP0797-20121207/87023_1 /TAXON_ID=47934 /ORGANISM="Dinophysis acuminata, Strain DAEP01" /LENGTH=221 /DNA_ID=CAMNT_0021089885 /DNA_START=292 /DNA_END=957 /DNA_ORIENTATION=+
MQRHSISRDLLLQSVTMLTQADVVDFRRNSIHRDTPNKFVKASMQKVVELLRSSRRNKVHCRGNLKANKAVYSHVHHVLRFNVWRLCLKAYTLLGHETIHSLKRRQTVKSWRPGAVLVVTHLHGARVCHDHREAGGREKVHGATTAAAARFPGRAGLQGQRSVRAFGEVPNDAAGIMDVLDLKLCQRGSASLGCADGRQPPRHQSVAVCRHHNWGWRYGHV